MKPTNPLSETPRTARSAPIPMIWWTSASTIRPVASPQRPEPGRASARAVFCIPWWWRKTWASGNSGLATRNCGELRIFGLKVWTCMNYWKLWVLPRRYELLETGVAKLLDLCKTLMLDEVRREPQADKADQLPRPSIVASTDVSPMFDTLFRIWHPNSKVDHLLDICRLANGTQEIRAFFWQIRGQISTQQAHISTNEGKHQQRSLLTRVFFEFKLCLEFVPSSGIVVFLPTWYDDPQVLLFFRYPYACFSVYASSHPPFSWSYFESSGSCYGWLFSLQALQKWVV